MVMAPPLQPYPLLKQKLEAMQWNVVDRRILQLVEDVTSS